MNDFDQPRRRPDDDNDDEDRPPRPRYLDRRPGSRGKTVSVIGIVALVIGVISFVLSLMPCLNVFTWPLAIIGGLLALIGILISAVGQREGLSVPVIGMVVNALALVVTVGMYVGFCGFTMQGARQAAVAAQQQAQAEAELQAREDTERREKESANVATVIALAAGPQGVLVGLAATGELLDTIELPEDAILTVDLDQLVRDFDLNPTRAKKKYQDRKLLIRGTVERVSRDGNENPLLVVLGAAPIGNKVECVFDDPDLPKPGEVAKRQRVTIEGTCEGRKGVGEPVWLSSCKIVK